MAGEGGHEVPLGHGAVLDPELVVGPGPAAELDLHVVLVGPEVGDGGVRQPVVLGEDEVAGGRLPLLHGVGPVLDPHPLVEERVVPPGDVAGGDDVGDARPAVLVADDAVVEGEPRGVEPAGGRDHAGADDDHVGRQHPAVAQADRLDRVAALEAGDGHAAVKADAVVEVQMGAPRPGLGAERGGQRHWQRFDDVDVEAPLAGGGGHLGADEPGADHRHPPAGGQRRPQRQAVVEGPQHVDASEGRLAGEPPGGGAGGDHEPVEGDRFAISQPEDPRLEVDAGGGAAEAPVDLEPLDGRRGAQRRQLGVGGAGQDLLGQRGTVVGEGVLGPHGHDPAVVAERAECLDGRQAGQGGADDHDRAQRRGQRRPFPAGPAAPGGGGVPPGGTGVGHGMVLSAAPAGHPRRLIR